MQSRTWTWTLITLWPVWSAWRLCSVSVPSGRHNLLYGYFYSTRRVSVWVFIPPETFKTLDADEDGLVSFSFAQVGLQHSQWKFQIANACLSTFYLPFVFFSFCSGSPSLCLHRWMFLFLSAFSVWFLRLLHAFNYLSSFYEVDFRYSMLFAQNYWKGKQISWCNRQYSQ